MILLRSSRFLVSRVCFRGISSKVPSSGDGDKDSAVVRSGLAACHGPLDNFRPRARYPAFEEDKSAYKVLVHNLRTMKHWHKYRAFPGDADVLIVGGGLVGASIAYYMSKALPELKLTVVQRDECYMDAGSVIGFGGFRSQFSLEENIELTRMSIELLKELQTETIYRNHIPESRIDFNHNGFLILADETQAHDVETSVQLQAQLGVRVCLLSPGDIRENFPWINTDGVAVGSYGMMDEGFIKPWELLAALRIRATSHGANFVEGTLIGFDKVERVDEYGNISYKLKEALVLDTDNDVHPIRFARLIIAAGSYSAKIAEMCGLGCEPLFPGLYCPLPVVPLKRHMFTAYSSRALDCCMDNPIVRDPSGAVFVKAASSSNHIICLEPMISMSEPGWDREIDPAAWHRTSEIVRNRIFGIDRLMMRSARAAPVDFNIYDSNWILGPHPFLRNVSFACGSSGMGIQHALGIGKAVYELQSQSCFTTIDLNRLGFDRIVNDTPLSEFLIF